MVRGEVAVNERSLNAGDGAAIVLEEKITLKGLADNTEVLLFDLA